MSSLLHLYAQCCCCPSKYKGSEFDARDWRERVCRWPAAASWELTNATVWAESLVLQTKLQWLQNTCVPLSAAAASLDEALCGDECCLCVTVSLVTDFGSSVLLLIGLLAHLTLCHAPFLTRMYCYKAAATTVDTKVMSMTFYCSFPFLHQKWNIFPINMFNLMSLKSIIGTINSWMAQTHTSNMRRLQQHAGTF